MVWGVGRGDMEEICEERKTEDGFCHLNRGSVPNLFTYCRIPLAPTP